MKQKILSHLPGDFPWQVHWFDTIDSTNTRAKAMAQNDAPHGTVLIAGQQTSGRGRMGRSFSSAKGKGIYLSVILRPECPVKALMHLTCAAGVAACDAIQSTTGFRPGIKWINDLVAGGKKLGGILTELSVDSKSGLAQYAVIGIGINCSQTRDDFPDEIRDLAVSLETVTQRCVCCDSLAAALIRSLQNMDRLLLQNQDTIMTDYKKDCVTLGRQVIWHQNDTQILGTAVDIDGDGALLVKTSDGSVQTVNSGEVSIRGVNSYV